MDEQKPGRRIVSRGEYAGQISKKIIYLTVACLGAIFSGFCCIVTLLLGLGRATPQSYIGFLIGCPAMLLLTGGSIVMSRRLFKLARSITLNIPLTCTNIADLPAEESLVRASVEPVEQQSVLLRPAVQSDTTPAEQLVRPANGSRE